jgi:predicted MFS family arabinose efflux permease
VSAAPTTGLEGRPAGSTDVRRITGAVVVSALGTWSYNVGIAFYAYQETHSTSWVAGATVGRYVPALILTWYGTQWVDRFPRRSVAVVADLVCAATMIALTLVAASHGPLLLAIALAALSSGVARIQNSAALAVSADLIAESRLVRSMALITSAEAVATAVGPALASIVLALWTPQILFLINGLTFAVSGVLLTGVRDSPHHASGDRSSAPRAKADRVLVRFVWPLLATRAIAAFVYGVDVVLLAVIATEQSHQHTAGYGWLLAAAGTGGLLAALILRGGGLGSGPRRGGSSVAAIATGGIALSSVPLVCFLLEPGLGGSLATQVVRGFGCVLVTATVISSLQRAIPSAAAGPIFGLTHTLVLAGTCTGALAAPVLIQTAGLHATLVVAASLPLVLQLGALPALRRFDASAASQLAVSDPRVAVLRGLSLFQDASRATLIEMASGADELAVDPVLASGSVVVTSMRGDAPVVLRTMPAPAYFGEIGIIHGVPRTATVTTAEPCVLWRIPAETFLSAAVQAGLSGALSESVRVRLSTVPGGPLATTQSQI